MREARGLIHLYAGDGKGKTTASMGLSIRAAGRGMRVVIVQFLKGQVTGELKILETIPNIQVIRGKGGVAFSFSMTDEEKRQAYEIHTQHLKQAIQLAQNGECDLLILDEAVGACNRKLLDEALLRDFVEHKPEHLELVLTGRNPPQWMQDAADYYSEVCKRKHPYDQGIPARVGIER